MFKKELDLNDPIYAFWAKILLGVLVIVTTIVITIPGHIEVYKMKKSLLNELENIESSKVNKVNIQFLEINDRKSDCALSLSKNEIKQFLFFIKNVKDDLRPGHVLPTFRFILTILNNDTNYYEANIYNRESNDIFIYNHLPRNIKVYVKASNMAGWIIDIAKTYCAH